MNNLKTQFVLKRYKKNSDLEEILNLNKISFKYINKEYFIEDISSSNIDILLNILSWEILGFIEKDKKYKLINEGYSSSFVSCISKNPFIAIYIKNKLCLYLMNNNQYIDINNFSKYNLSEIDEEYYKLIDKITFNKSNYITTTLKGVLFRGGKFNHINELTFDFINSRNKNDFDCIIYTDTGEKISSLSVDSTIKLYGLSIAEKNATSVLKNELNSAVATIISLRPKRVYFKGKYNNEIINEILKSLIKYGYGEIDYRTI